MTRPALVWTDAGLTFGVDRQLVQAVVRTPDFSRMPLGPVWLVGVINRFGRAVAVVDVGLEILDETEGEGSAGSEQGPYTLIEALTVGRFRPFRHCDGLST